MHLNTTIHPQHTGIVAAARDFFVNEQLCYMNSYYGKVLKNELIGILTGFYDDDEVSATKEVLYGAVRRRSTAYHAFALERTVLRKDSVNKCRLDCKDVADLIEFLDRKNIQPPMFHGCQYWFQSLWAWCWQTIRSLAGRTLHAISTKKDKDGNDVPIPTCVITDLWVESPWHTSATCSGRRHRTRATFVLYGCQRQRKVYGVFWLRHHQ